MAKISLMTLFIQTRKTRSALLTSFLFICVLLCALLTAACSSENERESLRFAGETMGTTYHVTLVANEGQPLRIDSAAIQSAVDAELKQFNQQMSTYIPDSELMLFNAANINKWHSLSQPLYDVLSLSQIISERSGGAFDITVGPLVNLWGFGPDRHEDEVPDAEAINEIRAIMGYQKLELNDERQARKAADIKIDLSAIAKGFGVDKVADLIERNGVNNYMVEIGGEIRVGGVNAQGNHWRIAIEQPSLSQQGAHKIVGLSEVGMATSGDYRNYFEKDGKRFSHTINPVTGYPIEHALVSVTVITKTAAEADAWATAINVLGPEKGMEVANREQLAAYMIVKESDGFSDRYSKAFSIYQ